MSVATANLKFITPASQLSLPYFEIKEVVNRKYLRDNFKQTGRASYYIEFSKIKVRDGFNKRVVYEDIPELAESIFIHGLKEPLTLDVLPDGTAYIEMGHRRHRAMQVLIDKKREGWTGETMVEFFSNKNEVTELERMVNQYTSNNTKKKLKPFEAALVAYEAKFNFSEKPKSNEEIAELLGVSRQQVDNYIAIASAPDELLYQMQKADMNLTDCLSLLKKQKQLGKQTAEAEEESHVNTAGKTPFPKDPLADEVKELAELDRQAEEMQKEETPDEREQRLLREKNKADQEREQLLEVSDEIKVKKLKEHIGRKLSADARRTWTEDFIDEDNGEVVTIDKHETLVKKGEVITEEIIEQLKDWKETGIDTIFVYKKGMEPVAASVITEPVAQKEKDKYDTSRNEIKQVQNCIVLADKLEAITNKFDIPEGSKKDIADIVKWMQFDLSELREWIHRNKPQNKRGS